MDNVKGIMNYEGEGDDLLSGHSWKSILWHHALPKARAAPLDEVGGIALGRYTSLYGFLRLVLKKKSEWET